MKFIVSLLLSIPALVLGAPSINQTLAALERRQVNPLGIESITFEDGICDNGVPCNSCVPGSVHIIIKEAGEEGSNPSANIGLDRWRVSIQEGEANSDFRREMACVFKFHLKNYPTGCSKTDMISGFHFFTELEDGLQAKVTHSYNMQPQSVEPTEGRFEQNQNNTPQGDEFTKTHTGQATAVRGDANQPQPIYSVEIRAFVVSDGVGQSWGDWALEDFNLGIEPPTSC